MKIAISHSFFELQVDHPGSTAQHVHSTPIALADSHCGDLREQKSSWHERAPLATSRLWTSVLPTKHTGSPLKTRRSLRSFRVNPIGSRSYLLSVSLTHSLSLPVLSLSRSDSKSPGPLDTPVPHSGAVVNVRPAIQLYLPRCQS